MTGGKRVQLPSRMKQAFFSELPRAFPPNAINCYINFRPEGSIKLSPRLKRGFREAREIQKTLRRTAAMQAPRQKPRASFFLTLFCASIPLSEIANSAHGPG